MQFSLCVCTAGSQNNRIYGQPASAWLRCIIDRRNQLTSGAAPHPYWTQPDQCVRHHVAAQHRRAGAQVLGNQGGRGGGGDPPWLGAGVVQHDDVGAAKGARRLPQRASRKRMPIAKAAHAIDHAHLQVTGDS
mmetsp:Transcript_41685/g.106685  ORF Transcript_41685/g.106685 Transcript_41685/m.106685 type:complete len:133 (-) Transcript_41685:626-1024(-)